MMIIVIYIYLSCIVKFIKIFNLSRQRGFNVNIFVNLYFTYRDKCVENEYAPLLYDFI